MAPPPIRLPRTTHLVRRLERLVRRELDVVASAEDLTASQYAALGALAADPGLSSAQLARRSSVTAQSMNEVVAALETRGLIEREPDPLNARVLRARLSPRGAQVLHRCDVAADEVEGRMLEGFDPDRLESHRADLLQQIDALDPASTASPASPASTRADVGGAEAVGSPATPTSAPRAASSLGPSARRDHQRNRDRILAAARELLAAQPVDKVQLDDVASRARVGRATLFRHIGSKEALVNEVFRGRLEDIDALAGRALNLDAWDGFELLVATLAVWMHEDRGLYDWIRGQVRSPAGLDPAPRQLVGRIDQVIGRAQREGLVWADLTPADLIPLLAFAAEPDEQRLGSFVDVLLRGLAVDGARSATKPLT